MSLTVTVLVLTFIGGMSFGAICAWVGIYWGVRSGEKR